MSSLQPSCRAFPAFRTAVFEAFGLSSLFPRSEFFSGSFLKYWDHTDERRVDVLSGCFWLVRREALEKVGLLDEDFFMYSEDVDWCRRFHEAGWEVVFYPGAEAIHFGEQSSKKEPLRCFLDMQNAQALYWRKHHGRMKTAVWAVVKGIHQFTRLVGYSFRWTTSLFREEESGYKTKRSLMGLQWVFRSGFGQLSVDRKT